MAKADDELGTDVKQALLAMAYIPEQQDLSLLHAALYLRKTFKSQKRLKDRDKSYKHKQVYRRLRWVRGFAMFVYLSLAFFEVPSWCTITHFDYTCTTHGHQVPWSNIPKLHNTATRSIEICCVIVLLALYTFRVSFTIRTKTSCIRDITLWTASVASIGDNLFSLTTAQQLMFSQYLRPLVFVLIIRSVRESLMSVLKTIWKASGVILLVVFHIVIFSWVGLVLFAGSAEGTLYFKDMQTSLWSMMVAITTTNFPDLMMPAYCNNRIYSLFFVVFYLVGLFFLFKLVLAFFYSSYRQQIEKQAKRFVELQTNYMQRAFMMIDTEHNGYIPKEKFEELMALLKQDLFLDVQTEESISTYLSTKERVRVAEFEDIIKFMYKHNTHLRNRSNILKRMFPKLYGPNSCRKSIVAFLNSAWFLVTFQTINLSIIIIEIFEQVLTYYYADYWIYIQIFYLVFYWSEMIARNFAFGIESYFSSIRGVFDFIINSINLVAFIIIILPNGYSDRIILVILGLTRLLYLLKIFTVIEEINCSSIPS